MKLWPIVLGTAAGAAMVPACDESSSSSEPLPQTPRATSSTGGDGGQSGTAGASASSTASTSSSSSSSTTTSSTGSWHTVQVPGYDNASELSDTKIYRQSTDGVALFVFSHGKFLSSQNPRTSYLGRLDADDSIQLTNLQTVAEAHTAVEQKDTADAHVYIASSDPQQLWLSWCCGSDSYVCAIRSDDGGQSFNSQTFFSIKSTGALNTAHEPAITCNSDSDCLLTWGETLAFNNFDLYYARFTSAGWCVNKVQIGSDRGLPLEMAQGLGNDSYRLGALAPSSSANTLTSIRLQFASATECTATTTDDLVLDTGFSPEITALGFPYSGAAANVAPRMLATGVPSWLMYSHDTAMHALRFTAIDQFETPVAFADTDPQVSLLAGNVAYDGNAFYAFYHRFNGAQAAEHPNSYSVCYRATADASSDLWGEEICPVQNQPALSDPQAEFHNMIQPVGSVWQGAMAIIFQKDCAASSCSLAITRNDTPTN